MFSFETFPEQYRITNLLTDQISKKKIPHAQLFIGDSQSKTLPFCLAYLHELLKDSTFKHITVHPDVQFSFPIYSKPEHPNTCNHFLEIWSEFISQNDYGDFTDWCEIIESGTKQVQIGVEEAERIIQFTSLKPFTANGYKIVCIWGMEQLNSSASNKLLKVIEEPPKRTLFILMTENENLVLKTIRSRCQILRMKPSTDSLLNKDSNKGFEALFISWVRFAFLASKKVGSFKQLIDWSESMAQMQKEQQKSFLKYASELFRQALLKNYKLDVLTSFSTNTDFNFESFSKHIGPHNIFSISEELDKAYHTIERNGHAKIIFNSLCINLSKSLLKKPNNV